MSYVEIPRPQETSPGVFGVELRFPASSKRRAEQHHHVARELALIHGVDARTPYKINPRWSIYEENWGNGERHGWLDERRLEVQGGARELARYLVALVRVLDDVEQLATRAVRVFGVWRRSAAAEPHLEYEDASTMRTRARDFRAAVLGALVRALSGAVPDAPGRDSSRPLWEQYAAVAGEVRAEAGGVDLERADERAVTAQMLRMVPDSEAGRAVVSEAEHLVAAEAQRVDEQAAGWAREDEERPRERQEASARFYVRLEAERLPGDEQMELFAEDAGRLPFVMPESRPKKLRRAPRTRVPVAARFRGITHVIIAREQVEQFSPGIAAAVWPEVSAERRQYGTAA